MDNNSSKNFLIVFGAIWTAFTAFITLIMIFASGIMQSVIDSTNAPISKAVTILPALGFMSIFWIIGIIILGLGIKKYKQDKATENFGQECYAKIVNVYPSGTRINNRMEFKADFLVYVPMRGNVIKVAEIIGFNPVDYPVNSYAKVKYYNNDINFIENLSIDRVPVNIRDSIDNYKQNQGPTNNTVYEDYSGYDDYTSKNDDNGPISYK